MSRPRYVVDEKAPKPVRTFQEICGICPGLDELERAVEFYGERYARNKRLHYKRRRAIREYSSRIGSIDLRKIKEEVLDNIFPCGTATRVGKDLVEIWVWSQLCLALSEKENQKRRAK